MAKKQLAVRCHCGAVAVCDHITGMGCRYRCANSMRIPREKACRTFGPFRGTSKQARASWKLQMEHHALYHPQSVLNIDFT